MDEHIDLMVECFSSSLNLFETYVNQKTFYEILFDKTGNVEYKNEADRCKKSAEQEKASLIKCYRSMIEIPFELGKE